MANNPETTKQSPANFSRRVLLSHLMPDLNLAPSTAVESNPPISRRNSLQLLAAVVIGGGVALSRDSIVWAGNNKGNTKTRTGSGDTADEKAKRQAKKGQEGRKSGHDKGKNKSHNPQEDPKRCAQGADSFSASGCAILPHPGRTR